MAKAKQTIIESWPGLKEDLTSFLSDTDGWIIAQLKEGLKAKDWSKMSRTVDIMDSIHDLSHSH